MTKQVLQQALDVLTANAPLNSVDAIDYDKKRNSAIKALRSALAQQSELGNASKSEQLLASYDHAVRAEFQRTKAALVQQGEQQPVAWSTKEHFYRELDRIRGEMAVKTIVMRYPQYDVALDVIASDYGHIVVAPHSAPEAQPVAWGHKGPLGWSFSHIANPAFQTPLYAGAAPAAQPGKNELKQLVIKYGLECMANHGTGPSVQAAWQDFVIALG